MRTIAVTVLAVALVGCGAGGGEDVAQIGGGIGAGGSEMCGQVAGRTYATHWARRQGTCAASGDLLVTVTNPGDLCGSIVTVPPGLGSGEFSIGCYIDTAACHVFAAVGFHGCQGDYSITFGS